MSPFDAPGGFQWVRDMEVMIRESSESQCPVPRNVLR